MKIFLFFLKLIFVFALTGVGFQLSGFYSDTLIGSKYNGPISGFTVAVIILALEAKFKPIFRQTTFSVIVGLIIGLTTSFLISLFVSTLIQDEYWLKNIQLFVTFIITYLSITTVIQTKDKFKFIIPYFEFRGQVISKSMTIIDTSALLDNRIINLIKNNLLEGQIILSVATKLELEKLAESSDIHKRTKGEVGLANYNGIKHLDEIIVQEVDESLTGETHSIQTIRLAEMHQAKILTCDNEIKADATQRNIRVINLNDLASCFHPPQMPGDHVKIKILKKGDNKNQGVGYLPDATMVVVENGEKHVGEEIEVEIKSFLQRHSGNLFFAIAKNE